MDNIIFYKGQCTGEAKELLSGIDSQSVLILRSECEIPLNFRELTNIKYSNGRNAYTVYTQLSATTLPVAN